MTIVLTCSQLGAAAGLDPYRSPVALWAELTGLAEPQPAGEAATWGTLLEPVVREEVERRGHTIMPGPDVLLANDIPWLIGHPDGYANIDGTRGILEVKTCGPYVRGWDDDAIPHHYNAQVHGYMALADAPAALVACLVAGQRLELRVVRRDDVFASMLLEVAQEFIGYVEREEPPPPDGTDATDAVLKRLYPRGRSGATVELTAADMVTVGRLRAMKEARKETERQEAELEQVLKLRLGEAEFGVYDGDTVLRWQTIVQHRKAQDARDVEFRRFSLGQS